MCSHIKGECTKTKTVVPRYTANDPCHPRCQFLYKDHYHCNVENCNMVFKSKDGVREHARYHDHQDRISSLSYKVIEADTSCSVDEDCSCSGKQQHYHCLWVGVRQRHKDNTFATEFRERIPRENKKSLLRAKPVPNPHLTLSLIPNKKKRYSSTRELSIPQGTLWRSFYPFTG